MDLTRKQFLAATGAAAGGLWAANAMGVPGFGGPDQATAAGKGFDPVVPPDDPTLAEMAWKLMKNNWYMPVEPLAEDEIRVSFMGTAFVPRIAQAANSIFMEVGTGQSFVFDLGMGTLTKYTALGVPFTRMEHVFITHLHADHMSDLTPLYCFGPPHGRVTPLHVYGPSGPRLKGAVYPKEGTKAFCEALYAMCAWHRESMSFLPVDLKPTAEIRTPGAATTSRRTSSTTGAKARTPSPIRTTTSRSPTSPPPTTATARSATGSTSRARAWCSAATPSPPPGFPNTPGAWTC